MWVVLCGVCYVCDGFVVLFLVIVVLYNVVCVIVVVIFVLLCELLSMF